MGFYNINLSSLDWHAANSILSAGLKENIQVDFKRQVPKDLAKTLSAFANTCGGCVILGVDEKPDGTALMPPTCLSLKGIREQINSIAICGITPSLFPEIYSIQNPSNETQGIVIVRINEGETVYAVNNNTDVYLRVDNISSPFKKATVSEINLLQNKKDLSKKNRDLCFQTATSRLSSFLNSPTYKSAYDGERIPTLRSVIYPSFLGKEFLNVEGLRNSLLNHSVSMNSWARKYPFERDFRTVSNGMVTSCSIGYDDIQFNGFIFSDWMAWWVHRMETEKFVMPHSIAELLVAQIQFSTKLYMDNGYFGNVTLEFYLEGIQYFKGRSYGMFNEIAGRESLDNSLTYSLIAPCAQLQSDAENLVIPIIRKVLHSVDMTWKDEDIKKLFSLKT